MSDFDLKAGFFGYNRPDNLLQSFRNRGRNASLQLSRMTAREVCHAGTAILYPSP
jgi:hypothetical protein